MIFAEIGKELNEDIAWRIGRALRRISQTENHCAGGDVRLTSEPQTALAKGYRMRASMYGYWHVRHRRNLFPTFHLGVDGGIEVTASRNPMDYNGMKLVR